MSVPRWFAVTSFEFAIRNAYSWIRKIAFGTEVAFDSVTASGNVIAASSRPATSIAAVGPSHAPLTSPFPASVGKPEKSGSSGTRFKPAIAAATAERTSAAEARVVAENATRFAFAARTPRPVSLRSSATFGTLSSMYTDREVKVIAYASAASAPSDRARRTASGARSRPSRSAASDDNLASHVRSAGGHGNVVLLAFPARPAVEGDLLRHPVDALQDRERVSGQGHPADALPDLALPDSESGLGHGLERTADGVFHAADPFPCQDAGLRLFEDLVLLVAARAEVRVRHANPDPAAEVLCAAVAGRAGLQHAGRLEAVQEAAVDPTVDDGRLVGRRSFRVERDGSVRPGISAVVVHRDERRSDFVAHLVREEGAFLHDLVALGGVAHHLVRQEAGDPRVGHDRHEAGGRFRGAQHLDRVSRDAPTELREVERLHEFPSRGPVPEIVRGLAAVPFPGDGLSGNSDADFPPLQAGAPGVRELEGPVGVGIRGVRVRDLVPLLGATHLHRGRDLVLPGHVSRLDPDLRLQGDRGGGHLAELRRRHAGRRARACDRDRFARGLDRVRTASGRPGCIAPRAFEECADAPAATPDLVHTLDLVVRDADDKRRAVLPADVAEPSARFLEGPHRGGHELRHAGPRRRAAIKGFRAVVRRAPRGLRETRVSIRGYILLWGYYFISRGPSRGRGTPHAVESAAVSWSAVLPDGHGELAEEAVCARSERGCLASAVARRHHCDPERRPERTRVRAVPDNLRRPRRRVRKRRRSARIEADVRHAEPRSPRVGRSPALLHRRTPSLHQVETHPRARIAAANSGATLTFVCGDWTVSVAITSSTALRFSSALPTNSPWTHAATTRRAPCFRSSLAAVAIVPPVEIASSTMPTDFPRPSSAFASIFTVYESMRFFTRKSNGTPATEDASFASRSAPWSGARSTSTFADFRYRPIAGIPLTSRVGSANVLRISGLAGMAIVRSSSQSTAMCFAIVFADTASPSRNRLSWRPYPK